MQAALTSLQKRCQKLLIGDAVHIGRQLKAARQQGASASQIQDLSQQIDIAEQKLQARQQRVPAVAYDAALPISAEREPIARAILDHQVLILCGETGSGKTTQLPKICLEMGRGVRGMIAHTQPRRIAARAVANRIAAELKTPLGAQVGYKVRFDEQLSADTLIKILTDGMLLAEINQDRLLRQYDTIIIDEAHERSLNIDFLLGYLKAILPKRPDLKIIITSATIDPESFAKHFANAPIIRVAGRSYPVGIEYRPAPERSDNQAEHIVATLQEIIHHGAGDVLIFVAGEREIREVHQQIKAQNLTQLAVLALYGRLNNREQARIFAPSSQRKVVIATNVAETSLTVPGIVYVIDAGTARIARYSYKSKIARLPIEPISQASAQQRAGRCGRVMAGICYRLYSEEDFATRAPFTQAEILRSNLAQVILQMEALNLGHIDDFAFIDKPDSKMINDGYKLLLELGAVVKSGRAAYKLTKLGRDMAKLPIDPKLARMILAAPQHQALGKILTIAAFLSIQDPRERGFEGALWQDARSDFIGILNLFAHYQQSRSDMGSNALRKWCAGLQLNFLRMREWQDARRQLLLLAKSLKLAMNQHEPSYEGVHKAILAGLIGNVGQRDEQNYLGQRQRRFVPFPTSAVKRKTPWLVAAELIETSRVFAHHCARVEPSWLEEVGAHLLTQSIGEPFFAAKSGKVCAYAKVFLYGLLINAKKRVDFAQVDAPRARAVFIREALVAMHLHSNAAFLRHNQRQIDKVRGVQDKLRREDLLEDGLARFDFYDQKLPAYIVDAASFEKWRKVAEKTDPALLFYEGQDILTRPIGSGDDYPDALDFNGMLLPLSYHFAPRQADDGVSVHLPLAALKQLPEELLGWLVEGMLGEKLCQLIKSLPKQQRTHVIPAPEYAKRALARMVFRQGDLLQEFARALSGLSGVAISAADFDLSKLDAHLFMRLLVYDASGKVLAAGRDLQALQQQFASKADAEFAKTTRHALERDHISTWDFGTLPAVVELAHQGIQIKGYPALVDMGESVAIRIIGSQSEQQHRHQQGLARLFALNLKKELKYTRRHLADLDKITLWYAPLGDKNQLLDDIEQALLKTCLQQGAPSDKASFEAQLLKARQNMQSHANEIAALLLEVFFQYANIQKRLGKGLPISWIEPAADIKNQLADLFFKGFITQSGAQLKHYPRYLKAIVERMDKLDHAPDKDRQRRAQVEPLTAALKRFAGRDDDLYWQAFWALQELRVSEFAQNLGTAIKISPQRMDNLLRALK